MRACGGPGTGRALHLGACPGSGVVDRVTHMAATTEALRTKVDSLQWEVNRLDVENRRLRAADEEATLRVDLESELEQTRQDVTTLTKELKECRGTRRVRYRGGAPGCRC